MAAGRQLARFQPTGVVTDVQASVLPNDVWSDVENIVFREDSERIKGLEAVFPTPFVPPEWALFTRNADETPVWIYPGATGVGLYDGSVHSDITPANFVGPIIRNPWTGGVLNSIPVLGSRRFYYWPGTGPMLALPDWPATRFAQAMRPYKFHLIAMGIDEGGTFLEDSVYWSSAAAPGNIPDSWTPAPNNEAGSTELSATGGQVIDGAALRSSFIIYKNTSTYVLDYVGGSAVMNVRLLFSNTGVLARNCVAKLGQTHIILTDGDVLQTDGNTIVSIVDGVTRRRMFSRISGANYRNSFVVSDESNGEVWVCVPEGDAVYPNVAYVYHRRSGKWGIRELPEEPSYITSGQVRLVQSAGQWDTDPQVWNQDPSPWDEGSERVDFYELLEVSPGGNSFYFVDGSTDYLGASINARLEKVDISLGDAQTVKTIKSVWFEVKGTVNTILQVEVAGSLTAGESLDWSDPVPYTIGVDGKVDVFETGRFLSIRITSPDVQAVEPWRVSAFTFEYEPRGLY